MVIKRSPGGQACRWRAINFEIHLWSSGKNADCIFGDRSASSMSKWRPAWTLTPEMIHFRTKSVTLSMLIDLLIIVHVDRRRWRAHQLTYDLKRCLLFRKCLRFFESESSFGAYICHRRPGGSMATSHLVTLSQHRDPNQAFGGTLCPLAKTLLPFSESIQVKFFWRLVQKWVSWHNFSFHGNRG